MGNFLGNQQSDNNLQVLTFTARQWEFVLMIWSKITAHNRIWTDWEIQVKVGESR